MQSSPIRQKLTKKTTKKPTTNENTSTKQFYKQGIILFQLKGTKTFARFFMSSTKDQAGWHLEDLYPLQTDHKLNSWVQKHANCVEIFSPALLPLISRRVKKRRGKCSNAVSTFLHWIMQLWVLNAGDQNIRGCKQETFKTWNYPVLERGCC